MTRTLTAAVHREEDWYVARCLEVAAASQGSSVEEAKNNLAEAVQLYLEEADRAPKTEASITSFQVNA